jgi:chemotaxis protein methyltransferase WspC
MLVEIAELLAQSIGLDVASVGISVVGQAVRVRQAATGLHDLPEYCQRLRGSENELKALVDAVVVSETWFFRDPAAFTAMTRLVLGERLAAGPDRLLRLLSLPCSTGEEPYSMAMALLDAGVPAANFHIDAIDVSAANIAAATIAVYGQNAFRTNDLGFRDRHFETLPGDPHRLAEQVRQQVNFAVGNMLDPTLLVGAALYDVVFCRNLLIYFGRATQELALRKLARLLMPNGLLFVGPAEAGLPRPPNFIWAKLPTAFAFRLADSAAIVVDPTVHGSLLVERARAPPVPHFPKVRPTAPLIQAASPQDLDVAQLLADQGRLADAAECCDAYLRAHGPSAHGYFLLGLIRDASGNSADAIAAYRKSLYVDPAHHDALVHLALLLERADDTAGARLIQHRIRRLEHRSLT